MWTLISKIGCGCKWTWETSFVKFLRKKIIHHSIEFSTIFIDTNLLKKNGFYKDCQILRGKYID
jgi:hypothetical protein